MASKSRSPNMPLPFCGQREALRGQSGPDGGSRSASSLRLIARPRPTRRRALPMRPGDGGLVGGNHLLSFGQEGTFTHNQGRLALAVVYPHGLLPGRMVLPELGCQGLKALLERFM